jgi:hypothetical protein
MNNIRKEVNDVYIMNIARLKMAEYNNIRLKREAFSFKLRKEYIESFVPVADNWRILNTAQTQKIQYILFLT